MNRFWIKLYLKVLDDDKLGPLPDWQWRRFFEFCMVAGEYDHDGLLLPVPRLAWRLRISEEKCVEALRALSEVGVVNESADGWVVTSFSKLQAAVPSTERVQAHRKRVSTRNENGTKRYTEVEGELNKDPDQKKNEIHKVVVVDPEPADDDDYQPSQPFELLSTAFEKATGILAFNLPRWNEAVEQLLKQGISAADVPALRENLPAHCKISGPWSLAGVPAAIFLESRRARGNGKAEPVDKYTGGHLSEFISS